ncbi:hypothetical protein Nepgr_005849 [Nepenthes gracilis]|uniref:Uncharacterized protein n=1 Tax=Nepenthes gracilis TaxID=150966 RepID=A0AAD3S490_NEPGR|nr:hypothetical protein Nepgr_005849 [Nepenthes gracilis]
MHAGKPPYLEGMTARSRVLLHLAGQNSIVNLPTEQVSRRYCRRTRTVAVVNETSPIQKTPAVDLLPLLEGRVVSAETLVVSPSALECY